MLLYSECSPQQLSMYTWWLSFSLQNQAAAITAATSVEYCAWKLNDLLFFIKFFKIPTNYFWHLKVYNLCKPLHSIFLAHLVGLWNLLHFLNHTHALSLLFTFGKPSIQTNLAHFTMFVNATSALSFLIVLHQYEVSNNRYWIIFSSQ